MQRFKPLPMRLLSTTISYIDLMPTLMHVAGVTDHGGKPLDGIDVLDALRGDRNTCGRELYHYWGQQGPASEQVALMRWPWKLVVLGRSITDKTAVASHRRRLLFNLNQDPEEKKSLTADHPQLVDRFYERLVEFRRLQPADALPPYRVGRNRDFQVPRHWDIRYKSSSER